MKLPLVFLAPFALAIAAACGGGNPVGGGASDAGQTLDAGQPEGFDGSVADATRTDADSGPDTGAVETDAGTANAPDAQPPPPPVPAKPGLALTAGGNVSRTARYRLVGAVGEAPGGNVIGRSPSYALNGGVVAGTQ